MTVASGRPGAERVMVMRTASAPLSARSAARTGRQAGSAPRAAGAATTRIAARAGPAPIRIT